MRPNIHRTEFSAIAGLLALSPSKIEELAKEISAFHKYQFHGKSLSQCQVLCGMRHQYGVSVAEIAGATLEGKIARLGDEIFWRRSLFALANVHRESEAYATGLIGANQPYCTNETFERFVKKYANRCTRVKGGGTLKALFAESNKGANKSYLVLKAFEILASERKFDSLLLTLTCPPSYHSTPFPNENSSNHSLMDAHTYLQRVWKGLIKHVSKKYKASIDYFGMRVTEIHRSGCPHLHILLFAKPGFANVIREKLLAILRAEKERSELQIQNILNNSISVSDQSADQILKGAISYIFKNAFPGICADEELIAKLRQRAAIGAAGVKQFQVIGAACRLGVIAQLRRPDYQHDIRGDISYQAKRLNASGTKIERDALQLEAFTEMLAGKADEFQLVKALHRNKYGESRQKVTNLVRISTDIITKRSTCRLQSIYFFNQGADACNYSSIVMVSRHWTNDIECLAHYDFYPIRAPPVYH